MELIEQMVEAQKQVVVAYTEFLQRFIPGDTSLHCFYEASEDIIYYHPLIRSIHPTRTANPYKCNDKKKVVIMFHLIAAKPEFVNAATVFFVDRDFDDPTANPKIYQTSFYSIENFYTQENSFAEFLTGHLGLLLGSADYDLAISLFKKAKNQFYQQCIPVNAYLRCIAKKIVSGTGPALNIDEKINFKSGVSLSVDSFHIAGIPTDLAGLETLFGITGAVTQRAFDDEIAFIRTQDIGHIGRGKFEMQFMVHFIQRFKTGIVNKRHQILGSLYKCKLNVDSDTFFNDFRSYAMVPDSLRAYIQRA